MQLGQPAPDFSLNDMDGRPHRLSDTRGKITVINFWSAECPWAERADRELLSYLREWGERVALLTIAANLHEPDEMCAASARSRGLSLVLRGSREVLEMYAAQITPHLFAVDEEGILRYRGAFDDVTFHQREPRRFFLREAVEALLAGCLPDPAETAPCGCTIARFMLE